MTAEAGRPRGFRAVALATAELVSLGTTRQLTLGDLTVVPAGQYTLVLRGARGRDIRLDGRRLTAVTSGSEVLAQPDLTRSTGVHRLTVGVADTFWFATEDTKLRLEGIQAMLEYLRGEGLGWSGQLSFSDGTYLRDPHVAYGWLDARADEVLGCAAQICRRPHFGFRRDLDVTSRGGARPSLRKTVALLRRDPGASFDADPSGPVTVAGRTFTPRRVVVDRRRPTVDTVANRRMAWAVAAVWQLATEVRSSVPSATPESQRCGSWLASAGELLFLARRLGIQTGRVTAPIGAARTAVEATDGRYATLYRHAMALGANLGWSAQRQQRDQYSYVEVADQIFQAFAAHVIAEGLGCAVQGTRLGSIQPAFLSEQWSIYYDVTPPPGALRSWRSYSVARDQPRPDILLVRGGGEVLLLDAKYREKASSIEEGRQDVMAYMDGYGLRSAVLIRPEVLGSTGHLDRIAGRGKEILEISIAPSAELVEFVSSQVAPVLADLAEIPPWRD